MVVLAPQDIRSKNRRELCQNYQYAGYLAYLFSNRFCSRNEQHEHHPSRFLRDGRVICYIAQRCVLLKHTLQHRLF